MFPGQVLFRKKKQQETEQNLTGQNPPSVSGDAQTGDKAKDKAQTKSQARYIGYKYLAGHTQPLQDTGEGNIQIHKGAEKSQGLNEMPCETAVEQMISRPFPGQKKNNQKKETEGEAVANGS